MSIYDLNAYEVLQTEDLSDLKSKGTLLKHKKSGARVLLMENDDENKVFTIGFRTPPSDSTGVPHIMEHSVLCGSKEFPVKDPFVELVKGSLNTFLNAMTYPDKTVYPVASCNDKDFQNLMHVYMDAVFYPNIYQHDKTFRQEGWSYKLDDPEGELTISGVVYNEMKGAFSSPEGVLDRVVLNSLFPDNAYSVESGGDPEVIPELTYEQFLDFHRKYYHPSNSYIYLYGDMDMEEKLSKKGLQRMYRRTKDCTAMILYNDEVAGSYMDFLKDRGLRVPEDISLVSFDDAGPVQEGDLTILSVIHPKYNLGRLTARNLLRMIEDSDWQEKKYSYRFPVMFNNGNSVRDIH